MSDDDTMAPDAGGVIAAEYVLGVLDAQERRAFERRLSQEPALASEVAFWERRLGAFAAEVAPVSPPTRAWARIEHTVRAPTPVRAGLWDSLSFWRAFAIGASGLAAASLVALVYVAQPVAPRTPLVASLDASGGQAGFLAAVTPGGTSVMVVPAALARVDQRVLELWLISPGERPRSLGLIDPARPVRVNIPVELVPRMRADAVLAVSLEPPGGSPTGQPTGPVIANGKLASL
jgi:anti-sigma-K factor RskA